MLVGDEHAVDLPDLQAGHGQAGFELAYAQPAVDQQPACVQAVAGLHEGGIAGAAAGQVLQTQHLEMHCAWAPPRRVASRRNKWVFSLVLT